MKLDFPAGSRRGPPELDAVLGAETTFSRDEGGLGKPCHVLAPWINWVPISLLKSQAPFRKRN